MANVSTNANKNAATANEVNDSNAGAAGNEDMTLDTGNGDEGGNESDADNNAETKATTGKGGMLEIKDKDVIKSIHNALGGQRVVFDTYDAAVAKVTEAAAKTNNFGGLPIVGFEAGEGVEVPEGHNWYVSTVTKREDKLNFLRAILVYPVPSTELFIAEQPEYVAKLVQRENADIIYSDGIRDAKSIDDLQSIVNRISLTTEGFVNAQRSAMDTTAFDEGWADFRAAFVKAKPAFDKAIPAKPLVLKAFRSASFAAANPFTQVLEERKNEKGESAWVLILRTFIKAAAGMRDPKTGEPKNYDLSVMESWLETRDTFHLAYNVAPQDVNADELSLDFG